MKIKDGMQVDYDDYVAKNTDSYGAGVVTYAERWAKLMEERIEKGESIGDMAKATGSEADTEGITGFQYGCAVEQLVGCWIHGEELRRWHNLDTQINNEGERANESGGVLNPAILTFGSDKE